MGWDKLPVSRQMLDAGKKFAVESWVKALDAAKGSAPSTTHGLAPFDMRQTFPNTYDVYVQTLTAWLKSRAARDDVAAANQTYSVLQPRVFADEWQVIKWEFKKHRACLVYPAASRQARIDEKRAQFNKPRLGTYDDGYIFDPWLERFPAVYQGWYWCNQLGNGANQVLGNPVT